MMLTSSRYIKAEEELSKIFEKTQDIEETIVKAIEFFAGEQVAENTVSDLLNEAEESGTANLLYDCESTGLAMYFSGLDSVQSILRWFVRYEVEVYHTECGFYITELF